MVRLTVACVTSRPLPDDRVGACWSAACFFLALSTVLDRDVAPCPPARKPRPGQSLPGLGCGSSWDMRHGDRGTHWA
jgi:hypothetical protein